VSLAGGDIIPAFSAVEIRSDGARQIKLYLHGGKDPGRLMGRLARGLDCAGAAGALDLFRYELLGHSPWPENGVFLSLHLENDTECRLKVDLDTCLTGASNAEIDRRIRRAIRTFGLADAEYSVVKDALTGNQTASRATIAAASCTAGGRDVAVNVYFQPASRGADRIRSR
jgi:hypothetical protein